MKKTILTIIGILILCSFAVAGDLVKTKIEWPKDKYDLLDISKLDISDLNCNNGRCYFSINEKDIDLSLSIKTERCIKEKDLINENIIGKYKYCKEWIKLTGTELITARDEKIKKVLIGQANEIKDKINKVADSEIADVTNPTILSAI